MKCIRVLEGILRKNPTRHSYRPAGQRTYSVALPSLVSRRCPFGSSCQRTLMMDVSPSDAQLNRTVHAPPLRLACFDSHEASCSSIPFAVIRKGPKPWKSHFPGVGGRRSCVASWPISCARNVAEAACRASVRTAMTVTMASTNAAAAAMRRRPKDTGHPRIRPETTSTLPIPFACPTQGDGMSTCCMCTLPTPTSSCA
jgi:hypothetical protein